MKNIPNILSFFRLLLIPIFVWQMNKNNITSAGIVLVISGLTDFLDGFLARKYNWITPLGKALDPLADKATQITVCIMFFFKMPSYRIFFFLLIFKEIAMLILGGNLIKNNIKLDGAKWFGKLATFLFYVTMIVLLFIPKMPNIITGFLLLITTISTIFAFIMYLPEYIKHKRKSNVD